MCTLNRVTPKKECNGCEFGEVYCGGVKLSYVCRNKNRKGNLPEIKLKVTGTNKKWGDHIDEDTSMYKSCPLLKNKEKI
jgi:hypothetical protein